MAAPSQVLYALHNSVEPRGFENLCIDLLVREGYARIIPGGKSRDLGRDAELRHWIGSASDDFNVVFQFSMEVKWEAKLRKDIKKIMRHSDSVGGVVFVSSRSVTIEKQERLRKDFKASHRIDLKIYDESWFRVRLEEEHVDLALKHLSIEVSPKPSFYASRVKIHGLTDDNQEELLRHTSAESLRSTLTDQTRADPADSKAWKGLAYVCSYLRDYDYALFCVSKSIKNSSDPLDVFDLEALKAGITAEQGIASGSRLLLKKAEERFLYIISKLGRSVDYYNLANVQGALGKFEVAESHYRRCLEIEPSYAQAWKNLGSLLIKMDEKREGAACLDKALELKPEMLEAIITKANLLVVSGDDCLEAIRLMDRAFDLDPDLEVKWPHAGYWKAMALCRQGMLVDAWVIVEDRLERKFDCPYLGRLAGDILSELWRDDPAYLRKSENFFRLRIDSQKKDYRAAVEMLELLHASHREQEAWKLLDEFFGLETLSTQFIAERIPLTILQIAESFGSIDFYLRFRKIANLSDYGRIFEECGLRPHKEVPEILFHFLLPAYFKLGVTFQDSAAEDESVSKVDIILETFRMISRIFASFGGLLLSSDVPETSDVGSELVAKVVMAGHDVPLMECSRLVGFLLGVANREIPERYQDALADSAAEMHEEWLNVFLSAIGSDWKTERWRNKR